MENFRFEIPRFGRATLTAEGLAECITATAGMTDAAIVESTFDDGWSFYVFEKGWEERGITRIELVAIWGECHGYGLD